MNSDLKGPKKATKKKYPYLGIDATDGDVVLFVRPDTGAIVHTPGGYSTSKALGHYSKTWAEDAHFEPLKGKITLSN